MNIQATAGRELPRVAFVSNFVAHYRLKMFEALASMCDLRCYLYSDGGEWYWQRAHGVVRSTAFQCEYLPGFWLGRVRVVPSLIRALLSDRRNEVFIKCINDKFALPVTWLAARCTGRPFILWTGVWVRLETRLHKMLWPVTRRLYLNSDAIVAYGEHVRRYLLSEGVEERRIFLAPQAVDNDIYRGPVRVADVEATRARLNIPAGAKVVLFLGRLERVKGIEVLLDAFARLREDGAVLVICGIGSLESALRARAEALGIASVVRFAGYVTPADAVNYYDLAWTIVLPSITVPAGRETWGLVANEAFNRRVPMIATGSVGAVAGGLVAHGRNGLVVPERDPDALAAALRRMIAEPGLRDRMGEAAYQDVAAWTQERMAQGFRDAIGFVLQDSHNQENR